MAATAVVRRYAEAFFELANERSSVDPWRIELARAVETLANEEVGRALANPRLPMADRVNLGLNLLEGSIPEVSNLTRLLIERHRIGLAEQLLAEYDRLADAARGVVRVEVTAAVPLGDAAREVIVGRLRQQIPGTIRPEFNLDPAIIGGLIVRIGDRVIDGSVRTHLQQLQAALA